MHGTRNWKPPSHDPARIAADIALVTRVNLPRPGHSIPKVGSAGRNPALRKPNLFIRPCFRRAAYWRVTPGNSHVRTKNV